MILIKTKQGDSYWTDEYKELAGFYVFETRTKAGRVFKNRIAMDQVAEMIEMDDDGIEKNLGRGI